MRRIILTLSLATLLTGAVSTNAYAACSIQLESGHSVIVKEINSGCINNIDDLFNCSKDESTTGDGSNDTIVDDSTNNGTTTDDSTNNDTIVDDSTNNDTIVDDSTNNDTSDETNLSYVEQIVELVNKERANAGLSAVTIDTKLATAASKRAHEIETSFAHTRPNGSDFSTVLNENGVNYRGAGENIAYGQKSPAEVMEGWMNSQGHRANILNPNFTSIGVGYYQNASGVNYWVQLFTY